MSKNQPPKAVLFDWNGTLNDMSVVLEQDKRVGREEFGLELSDEDVAACWGRPAETFFPRLFGRNGDTRPWQEMQQIFQSYDSQFPRKLLPDVLAVLGILKANHILTGIVTSGQRDKVLGYMQQMKLSPDNFHLVHTSHEIGADMAANRPILSKALATLALENIAPSEVVFVGDEAVTIRDAQAAQTDYVVVASGTVSKENLLQQNVPPHKLINRLGELPSLLHITQ